MSNITAQVMDQRCAERIAIGETVEFRCKDEEKFRTATMVDFSESGMLLMMDEKFAKGIEFEVKVQEEENGTIYFTVKCMRTTPFPDVKLHGYGCQIEEHHFEG
jgi:hypothetical protein